MKTFKLPIEKKLSDRILRIKKNYGLKGIKAEYEAEGSQDEDIQILKKICDFNSTNLYVKIGGVEAIRDIYKCIEIGVYGIIAPMVETKFAAQKYLDCINKFDLEKKFHLSINIETETGYKNYNEIIKILKNKINNVTIGRSDLSASFFNNNIKPDSVKISNIIGKIVKKNKKINISTTVGGTISKKTFKIYRLNRTYKNINMIETRKVILDNNIFFKKEEALNEALKFEQDYILFKKAFFDLKFKEEFERLIKLRGRT